MFRRVPSLVKLERLIGYRPTTPLETIIDTVANGSCTGSIADSAVELSDWFTAPVAQPA
jgi:hypothetical protein